MPKISDTEKSKVILIKYAEIKRRFLDSVLGTGISVENTLSPLKSL